MLNIYCWKLRCVCHCSVFNEHITLMRLMWSLFFQLNLFVFQLNFSKKIQFHFFFVLISLFFVRFLVCFFSLSLNVLTNILECFNFLHPFHISFIYMVAFCGLFFSIFCLVICFLFLVFFEKNEAKHSKNDIEQIKDMQYISEKCCVELNKFKITGNTTIFH